MADGRNRGDSKKATNDWLTPPELLAVCGHFDLDPACYYQMPWRTADRMISLPHPDADDLVEEGDGLALEWKGRVWCNPPWDDPTPWVHKMTLHNRGLMLTSAKSLDTKWGQSLLLMEGLLSSSSPAGCATTTSTGPRAPALGRPRS